MKTTPTPSRARRGALALAGAAGALAIAAPGAHAMCPPDMPCPAPTPAPKVAFVGKFNGGAKRYVAVHAAPSAGSKVVRHVRSGRRAYILCQQTGGLASGPYGTGRIWDRLRNGGYASDTQIYTGSDGRVAPPCTTPAPKAPPASPGPVKDRFMYDDPGPWNGGRDCAGGWTPGARSLVTYLRRHYRHTSSMGGYACRPNTANTSQMSVHAEGRAVDWMISASSRADRAIVRRFTRSLAAHNWRLARAMGIQELIWNHHIWTSYHHSEGWRSYTGPNPHTDHIHIGLNKAGAAKRTSFWR